MTTTPVREPDDTTGGVVGDDLDTMPEPAFDPDLSAALDALEAARQALDMAQAAIERKAGLR